MAPADLTVAHGDVALAVRDLGGDGPPVLLQHGVGGNLAHWALVGRRLRPRYRVLSVDLPAHGRSTVPERYSFADDVAAVHSVAQSLALNSPAVVGHSYGGMLAVAAAAERPDDYRVAVNVDGVGFPHSATPQELLNTWDREEGLEDPGLGDEAWLSEQIGRDEAMIISLGVSPLDATEPARRSYRRRTVADRAAHRLLPRAAAGPPQARPPVDVRTVPLPDTHGRRNAALRQRGAARPIDDRARPRDRHRPVRPAGRGRRRGSQRPPGAARGAGSARRDPQRRPRLTAAPAPTAHARSIALRAMPSTMSGSDAPRLT